jgi:hypothetical protein
MLSRRGGAITHVGYPEVGEIMGVRRTTSYD